MMKGDEEYYAYLTKEGIFVYEEVEEIAVRVRKGLAKELAKQFDIELGEAGDIVYAWWNDQ